MASRLSINTTEPKRRPMTLRDLVASTFRRKRLIVASFVCTFGLITAILMVQPNNYESELKILVKNNRIDPVVSSEAPPVFRVSEITAQDLSSEAQLLKSRDLLERAVVECNVQTPAGTFLANFPVLSAFASPNDPATQKTDPIAVEQAVRQLDEEITAMPVLNSNLISVKFGSPNPVLTGCVLKALSRLYLDKHLAVHRPGGAFDFFKQESEKYKQELELVEEQLAEFGQKEAVVTDGVEKEIAIRKLGDYNAALTDTHATIAQLEGRIRELESQRAGVQPRRTTAVRTLSNPQLTELKSTLVTLQMKRTELLTKYAPTYRTVQEVDNQIQQVREAIAAAEKSPAVEETTDLDAENEFIRMELAKARSELAALKASGPARENAIREYRARALGLDRKAIERQDLMRLAKVTEDKYLLYLHKTEEARIEQALDHQRILNVAIAQQAAVPVIPEPAEIPMKLGFAGILAAMLSLGIGLGADLYDRSFRTPEEVHDYLGIPVLASVPLVTGTPVIETRREVTTS